MNQDTIESNWPEMRGQIKEWWDALTDEDLDQVQEGTAVEIIPLLQRRYGTSQSYTEKEYNRRIKVAQLGSNSEDS